MKVFESNRVRRLVGCFERGESFVDGIQELAEANGITAGWVSAVGIFEAAEIQLYDGEARKLTPPRIVGAADLVHLSGNISLEQGSPTASLYTVLAESKSGGTSVVAGQLRAARVRYVEFVIESLEGVTLSRTSDPSLGISTWSGASTSEPRAAREVAAPVSGWAAAAAISERAVTAEKIAAVRKPLSVSSEPAFVPQPIPDKKKAAAVEQADEYIPKAGDWIAHKQFGLCEVEGEDDSGALIIRLPNTSVRKSLSLDYMRVLDPKIEGDKIIYPLEPRKR